MPIGGFQAIVKMHNYEFRCGFDDAGEPLKSANMELEGRLVEFSFGEFIQMLQEGHAKKVHVSLYIEFTGQQVINDRYSEEDKKYIGRIQAYQPSGEKTPVVYVSITLPYDLFSQICSVGEREITFDTIHDLITEPTEDQKTDHVVALVKRVYFSERK